MKLLLRHKTPPKPIPDYVRKLTPIQAAQRGGHAGVVRLLAAALAKGYSSGSKPAADTKAARQQGDARTQGQQRGWDVELHKQRAGKQRQQQQAGQPQPRRQQHQQELELQHRPRKRHHKPKPV